MKYIIYIILVFLLISIAIAQISISKKQTLFELYKKYEFKDLKSDDFEIVKDYNNGIKETKCNEIKDKNSYKKKRYCENITSTYPRIDYTYKGRNGTILGVI